MGEIKMQGNYYNSSYNNLEQYIVQKNDSLYMIAKKYNVSVEELKKINHLVTNMIYPNQILFIPKTTTYPQTDSIQKFIGKYPQVYSPTANTYSQGVKNHVVGSSDTIEDLLARYHLSPIEFLKLNEKIILKAGENLIVG